MKKLILITILVGLIATPALASMTCQYWDRGVPGSTWQDWEFETEGKISPGPEDEYRVIPEAHYNPYGLPELHIWGAEWDEESSWVGEEIDLMFVLQNQPRIGGYKDICIVLGFDGVIDDGWVSGYDIDGNAIPLDQIWGYACDSTVYIHIWPNPMKEDINLTLVPAVGAGLVSLDYAYIDTICIPAPGAVLLGGIGVGLVGWLRRRRML